MLYEVRLYAIPPGRIADIEQRMLRNVPPLFAEHGMRAVGHWTIVAGSDLPAFLYILEWKDAAERDACWQSFYGDQRWWDLRAGSNAGSELVESYGLWLMKPNAVRKRPFAPTTTIGDGEIHEMLMQFVSIGESASIASHLETMVLPAIEQAGGTILSVLDMVAGPRFPLLAIFMAWPDFHMRTAGRRKLEKMDVARNAVGAALLGRSDVYLLQPMRPERSISTRKDPA